MFAEIQLRALRAERSALQLDPRRPPRNRGSNRAESCVAPDDESATDDDESWADEEPYPPGPNWDDFDLEEIDDEPDPADGDFWIDPDEFTDPWNFAARRAEE